jgi:hypothetical protein
MLSEDLTYRQVFLDGRPLPQDRLSRNTRWRIGRATRIDGKGKILFVSLSETSFSPRLGGVSVFYFGARHAFDGSIKGSLPARVDIVDGHLKKQVGPP